MLHALFARFIVLMLAVVVGGAFPNVADAQKGSGPSGKITGDGMELEWHVSGADVGEHFFADRAWQAPGTVTSKTVRFWGVMRASVPSGMYTDTNMSAYISLPMSVDKKEVKWGSELSSKNGLSHELPFDLTLDVPPGKQVLLSASVNKVGGAADLLGVFFQFNAPKTAPVDPTVATGPSGSCAAGVDCCYVAASDGKPPRYSVAFDSPGISGIVKLAGSGYPNRVIGPSPGAVCWSKQAELTAATTSGGRTTGASTTGALSAPRPATCTVGRNCCYVASNRSKPRSYAVAFDDGILSGIAKLASSGYPDKVVGPVAARVCWAALAAAPASKECTLGVNCCYIAEQPGSGGQRRFAMASDQTYGLGDQLLRLTHYDHIVYGPVSGLACVAYWDAYIAPLPGHSAWRVNNTDAGPQPIKPNADANPAKPNPGQTTDGSLDRTQPSGPGTQEAFSPPDEQPPQGIEPTDAKPQLPPGPDSAPGTPRVADALGSRLDVNELDGLWTGVWTRRPGTDVFDAVWRSARYPEVHDVVRIETISGDQVVFAREGNRGRYFGTLSSDGSMISGTASWYSPGMTWSARIGRAGKAATGKAVDSPDPDQ
jgi:hypothetical protein